MKQLIFITTLILMLLSIQAEAGKHAVILQYHHFGDDTPPSTSVTMEQFRDHLDYLKDNHFNVLPLETVIANLRSGATLPENCIAITIDDAYRSIYERAFPLLKEYGYPFTVFVNTEGVVRGIKSYMTWDQMREMRKWGASFSSHSHTHDNLIRLREGESASQWKTRVTSDIKTSLNILKKELDSESTLFAYPYGEYNSELKEVVETLKLTGVGQHSGAIWSGGDFSAVPRYPMAAQFAEMGQFQTKVWTMPLPVISEDPSDPQLPSNVNNPALRIKLQEGDYNPDSIACFASGQGKIKSRWVNRDKLTMEVQANTALPLGRSRYNCTARHNSEDRYYWYSHLWIKDK